MSSEVIHKQKPIEAGSAYLNKPLRTLEQAKADIERAARSKAQKREG